MKSNSHSQSLPITIMPPSSCKPSKWLKLTWMQTLIAKYCSINSSPPRILLRLIYINNTQSSGPDQVQHQVMNDWRMILPYCGLPITQSRRHLQQDVVSYLYYNNPAAQYHSKPLVAISNNVDQLNLTWNIIGLHALFKPIHQILYLVLVYDVNGIWYLSLFNLR